MGWVSVIVIADVRFIRKEIYMKLVRKDKEIGRINLNTDALSTNVVNAITKTADKAVKNSDKTYTGRIVEIETLADGTEKYKVIFDNKIKYVPLNEGVHYKNEIVRVYVPNGNLSKAYGESVESKPASRIIISGNSMTFETDVDVESFYKDDSGKLVADITPTTITETFDLTRDSYGRPVKAVFPDKSEVTVEYKD